MQHSSLVQNMSLWLDGSMGMSTNNPPKHLESCPCLRLCAPNLGCCRITISMQERPRFTITTSLGVNRHAWQFFQSILSKNGPSIAYSSSSQTACFQAQNSPIGSLLLSSGQNMLTASTYFTRCANLMPNSIQSTHFVIWILQLPEHLKNYHKTWTDNRNEENSIEQHRAAYNDIRSLLDAAIPVPPIPVAQPLTLDQEIDTPQRRITSAPEVSDWHIDVLLGNHMTKQSATQFYYGERAPPPVKGLSNKCSAPTDAPAQVVVKKRKPRTCVRCRRSDCQGAFRGRPCQHSSEQVCCIISLDLPVTF